MISPYSWWCGVAAVGFVVVLFTLLLIPGAAVWLWLARRVDVPAPLSLLLALACTATLGYATFWIYVAHPVAGRCATATILGATVAALVVPRERRRLVVWLRGPDVAPPVVLLVGSACFALTWYLAFVATSPLPENWGWVNNGYTRLWIPDSSLPLIVAHKLARGTPLHEGLFAAESIARTPLQAGMVLLHYPAWQRLDDVLPEGVTLLYEAFGVVVQSFWIAAVWGLLRLLGQGRRRAAWLLLALAASHFFVLNVAYVWPKLLSASFVVGSYCLLLLRPAHAPPLTSARAAVAAALACLGLLAHPAVATTLMGFGVLLLVPWFFPGWRSVVVAALVVGALGGPWLVFQQTRPIDYSLAKRFVAGASAENPGTIGELARHAWLERPPGVVAREKWDALRTLAGFGPPASHDGWQRVRVACRESLGPSLGILNVGWLVALVGLAGRRHPAGALVRRTLGVGLVCLGTSLVVLFESGLLRHTSYATVTLLFAGLGAAVMTLPTWLAALVLGAHVVSQLLVFSTQLEAAPFPTALPTLTCSIVLYSALTLALVAASRSAHRSAASS